MHAHRSLPDGSLRDSDHWQLGIPKGKYVKSLVRHTFDLWRIWRGGRVIDKDCGRAVDIRELCCAVMFNVMGLLHELLREDDDAGEDSGEVVAADSQKAEKRQGVLRAPGSGREGDSR